jgi:hypothetical protein
VTAPRHWLAASARKIRSVARETRWRWRLKVLWMLRRERKLQRFKSARSAQRLLSKKTLYRLADPAPMPLLQECALSN